MIDYAFRRLLMLDAFSMPLPLTELRAAARVRYYLMPPPRYYCLSPRYFADAAFFALMPCHIADMMLSDTPPFILMPFTISLIARRGAAAFATLMPRFFAARPP